MAKPSEIREGDKVTVIFPWREDETPTEKNFFTGKVIDVISKSAFICYVRIAGLDRLIPVDRVSLA